MLLDCKPVFSAHAMLEVILWAAGELVLARVHHAAPGPTPLARVALALPVLLVRMWSPRGRPNATPATVILVFIMWAVGEAVLAHAASAT